MNVSPHAAGIARAEQVVGCAAIWASKAVANNIIQLLNWDVPTYADVIFRTTSGEIIFRCLESSTSPPENPSCCAQELPFYHMIYLVLYAVATSIH